MVRNKEIDKDRCFFNPETGDTVFSHYIDGTSIVLSNEEKAKADLARAACIKQSLKAVEESPAMKRKPLEKRGRGKPKQEEPKKEV